VKVLQTAVGALQLAVPQVRGSATPFRASLLEKGGLRAACNSSPWQRCQFHLQQNAGHLVTAVLV